MKSDIYNSRKLEMTRPYSCLRWALCLCVLFSQLSFATDWHDPVTQLTAKITAATGPGVVALEVNNRSSLSAAETDEIRRELTASLATSGVRVWQPDQAAANIKLTLSENLQEYVWVAEIQSGANDSRVLLVSTPRTSFAIAAANAPAITIRRTPLVSQADPVLDVAVVENNPPRIVVLGRTAVTIQEFSNQHWLIVQSLPVRSPTPLPRDARGRIFLRKDHLFDAYLPGLACHSTNSTPLSMSCALSEDPWPLQAQGLSAFFSPASANKIPRLRFIRRRLFREQIIRFGSSLAWMGRCICSTASTSRSSAKFIGEAISPPCIPLAGLIRLSWQMLLIATHRSRFKPLNLLIASRRRSARS
jgi:hypothetical protein